MSSFTSSVDLVMAAMIEFSLPFHGSSGVSISLLCAPFLRKISTLWFLVADLFLLDGGRHDGKRFETDGQSIVLILIHHNRMSLLSHFFVVRLR